MMAGIVTMTLLTLTMSSVNRLVLDKNQVAVADTMGLHKASPVDTGYRFLVMFQYNMSNWGKKRGIVP